MIILQLIWIHFISDFILQTDKMALNKSSSIKYLSLHCLVYSIPFVFFGIKFALFVGLSHFVIDYFTSKINNKLWSNNQRHWFFVCIGFDQAIHLTTLILLKGVLK